MTELIEAQEKLIANLQARASESPSYAHELYIAVQTLSLLKNTV